MRIQDNGSSFAIWLSADDTHTWATDAPAWPCSQLRGKRLRAEFDVNGLVDYAVNGRDCADLMGDELSAIVADFAGQKLPTDHPCYFVAVGQFRAGN